MKILSHFVGTVILFVFLIVIVETIAFYTPLGVGYIASMIALALFSSFFVYEVSEKWLEK